MSSVILQVEHLSKRFGIIPALDHVSLEVRRNEIVGLLGQNGSGKSTLTKILVGVEKPDEGKMTYLGRQYVPKNPLQAAMSGISIAYQEGATVPDLRVFEWMYLGREMENNFGMLRTGEMKRRCQSILEELGINCIPQHQVRDLPAVTKKMIEIARAIQVSREGRQKTSDETPIIILDEPTAPLTESEREVLFAKLEEIKRKSSFLFISHFIPEVLEAANRIYVLRDGKNAGTFDLALEKVTEQMVYRCMFAEEMAVMADDGSRQLTASASSSEERVRQGSNHVDAPHEATLRVINMSRKNDFYEISFDVRKGEIICIDGTLHSGKMEIVKTIAGIIEQDQGTVEKDGRALKRGVRGRISSGIGYFSGERSDELFLIWPIIRNITITVLNSLQQRRWLVPTIDGQKERRLAEQMVNRLEIHPSRLDALMRNLSGGNMQKVGLAKWLSLDPDILILNNPTLGIDTKTKMEIYDLLRRMKKDGKSIILVSEDPDEVRRLSDRILKVENGRVTQILPRDSARIEH